MSEALDRIADTKIRERALVVVLKVAEDPTTSPRDRLVAAELLLRSIIPG